MLFIRFLLFLSVLWLCLPVSAHAVELLEEINVVADAPDSRNDVDQVDLEQFSGFAKRIEREEFNQQINTVSDVLDRTTGVQVRQIGGYGGFSTLSMRGSSGKQVNVYLDSMLINSAQTGSASLNLVPASVLDRIDIYPDFTPVQLGNANLGGAINIVTLDVFEPMREVSVAQGSYGRERYALTFADRISSWNFLVSADTQAADNDYDVLNNQATTYNPDDDVFEAQNNAGYDQQSVLTKLGTQWSANEKLEFLLSWSGIDKEVPAINNNNENQATLNTNFLSGQVKYNREYGHVRGSHRLYSSLQQQTYDDRLGTAGIGTPYLETTEFSQGFANIFSLDWWQHFTTVNLEYREDTLEQDNLYSSMLAIDNQRKQWLGSIQDDIYWMDDALLLTLAVRYFHIADSVLLDEELLQGYSDTDYVDITDDGATPSLGVQYTWMPSLKLKANVARQTRQPTMQERFGVSGQMVGNPDLVAEDSTVWDAGIIYELKDLALEFSYFEKSLENGIVFEHDTRGVAKAVNLSEAEINGIALDGHWQALHWLKLSAGGAWMDTTNLSESSGQAGKKLPDIYQQSFNAGAEIVWQCWLLRLLYQNDDELYFNTENSTGSVSKELVDLQLRWAAHEWSIQFNANNLLDEHYEDSDRYWGSGRSFDANVTVNW